MDVPQAPVSIPSSVQLSQPSSKLPLILFGIVLILSAGLGGLYLGKYLYGPKTPAVSISPIVVPTATPTPDPTANWKTYTNSKLGFTFQYPTELVFLSDGLDNGGSLLLQNFDGIKSNGDTNTSFQLALFKTQTNGSGQITTINSYRAIRGTSVQKKEDVPTVWITNGTSYYMFQLSTPKTINSVWFDQILSTFQFTK